MFFVESDTDIEILASPTFVCLFPEGSMGSQTSIFSHCAEANLEHNTVTIILEKRKT